jgi:hypothetical protein
MEEGGRPEDRIDFGSLERLSANAPPPKEPSSFVPKLVGTLAFLAVASVVVAVPWYFLTRTGTSQPTASPTARATSASPSPSPSPSAFPAGTYEVAGVDHCANVRSAPGVSSPQIDCLTAGVRVTSDGKTEDLGGFTWVHVNDPFKKGAEAWMASLYLKRVE